MHKERVSWESSYTNFSASWDSLRSEYGEEQHILMDETHLTSMHWLKDGRLWSFVDERSQHLIELTNRGFTDFMGDSSRLEFHPDPILLVSPSARLCR